MGTVWADEEMITPQWTTDFAKGQTDGKVPPEVKTKEKEKPIGGCSKTNKDGSQEWDVVYHDDKTGETTTIYYIKTKDKAGKPKTVWKIKVEKPGQPPKTTTYDPEPGNPTKTEQVDDKTPTSTKYDPAKDYVSQNIGYGPGVTIGEPPEYVPPSGYTSPTTETTGGGGGGTTTEKTGGGGGGTTEKGGGPPPPGGSKGGGLRTETGPGGGGTTTENGGGGGGGKTTENGGGGGGKTTREKVPPPKKPKEPPLNLKLVTYGGPPGETVIHLGEKPPTTPQEYVHKNPTPHWDHPDGGDPKIPVEPTHPVPGEIITEHHIPHNDQPHVTETVKIPGESYTETTHDGWINIGSGWAYTRIPVSFVDGCVEQTQEKVTETTPTGGGGTTTETTGGGNTEEPPSTQEASKKLAKQKEALNPPPPPTQTKDDCGPWDGKYNPNGEGEAIKNSRYDVARFEKEVASDKEWRNPDPDIVECVAYALYDQVTSDKIRHDEDQLTRSKWQVEIYEAAYRAARAKGICNESAHFYGATAVHDWLQKVQWDFIQRMTMWLQALGSAIMAAQVAQDLAANFAEISKAKDATAQRKAFDESVARVKARNAAAESGGGGGGASEGGGGGGGRTGPGETQVLGPGENPGTIEKAPQTEETQTLPPGQQTQEKTQTLPPGEATEKNFTGEKPPACKAVKKGDGGSTKEKLVDDLLNTRVRMDEREKNMKVIRQRLTEDSNARWLESEGRQPPKEWRKLTPEQRTSLEAAEAKMIQENGIDSQKAVDLSNQIRPQSNAPLLKPDGTPITADDLAYRSSFGQWPPPGWPP